jgi:glycosyltransferase involved in cell wall biosynthesis
MLFAVSLKRKYGIPFVISEHWSGFLSKQNRKTIALAKIIAKNAELVIPVSKELKKGLQLNGIVKEANVIGNVIDTDLFCISQEAKDQFIFLHISNLIPLKNSEKIIKVASKLYEKYPHFQLQIGGDGDVEKLKNWVKKYKAEVFTKTFGLLSHKEVAKKMQQSSCFVLFSDMETQGIVLLESLSIGVPVIATNVGGIPEIVDKKRGILVENNNEDVLLEAMKSMLEKNVELDSSEDLRKYVVENFSKSVIAEKFSEIYNQVLS